MKIFAFIMALMVLGMSCLPCGDSSFATDYAKAKVEMSKRTNQEDQDHNENCSPFCHCSCCAGVSITPPLSINTTVAIAFCRSFSFYSSSELIEVSLPVWQPPQIA
jgi:hypothetical protein